MIPVAACSRPFVPGTTGWTTHDLDDADIERQWFAGAYEIVDGVLTTMPPAYFLGGQALDELVFILKANLKEQGLPNRFGGEADIVIDEDRVARPDEVWLTPEDWKRHSKATRRAGRSDPRRTRILVPPTLIIESVSPRHERHDERTKRRWYAEFGVPNYWILNSFSRSLKCLVLDRRNYHVDVEGGGRTNLGRHCFQD